MSTNSQSAFRSQLSGFRWASSVQDDSPAAAPEPTNPVSRLWSSMSGYVPLRSSERSDEEEAYFALSRWERFLGFLACCAGGVACFFIAFLFLPILALKPRKFALAFTLGSCLFMLGFAILQGPLNHLKHILSAERLPFSLAYFGSLGLTLWFAVGARSTIGTLIAAIVQVVALLSYFAAYMPGGLTTLRFGGQMDDFKDLVATKRAELAPGLNSRGRRPSTPGGSRSRDASKARGKPDDFLQEAYRIYTHLDSLSTLLRTIRRPYLSLAGPGPSRRPVRTHRDGEDDEDDVKRWEGVKHLTDRERDEIDLRAKMILRRCRERVSVLEAAERQRADKVAPAATTSLLGSFLPSLLPASTAPAPASANALIKAHRAGILWTLSNTLTKLTSSQTSLQEERAARRMERTRTLGARALADPAANALPIIPTGPAIESNLTSEQLQQFESENDEMLHSMESTLSAVLQAESALLEIATLQSELVGHLVQQTELTDKLHDDAVATVADVQRANEQLRKAKERGGEARVFLLVFLIGASLALLFLNWYS